VLQIIEEAIAARREELARGGFALELALDLAVPAVWGDAKWLKTAVGNLLNNAEKYAGERRWIGVKADYAPDAHEVRVTVEDHGIGIDRADFDRIFEPFARGRRAAEAQIPGSGIGLSLVRSLAEAHGGSELR